jgi:hypothetical protein
MSPPSRLTWLSCRLLGLHHGWLLLLPLLLWLLQCQLPWGGPA